MATTYTPSLRLAQMQTGDPQVKNNWGVVLDAMIAAVEQAIVGTSPIDLTGRSTYTLTTASNAPDQARQAVYNFTGALTSNCIITIPSVPKVGWIINNTTGGFYVALTTAGGSQSLLLPPQRITLFTCDGANVIIPQPFLPTPLMSSGPSAPAITGAAATSRALFFDTGLVNRWATGASGDAETGGNAGSNWSLWRYTDAGALIDAALTVNRASGQMQVKSLASTGAITAPAGTSGNQVVNFSQFSPQLFSNANQTEVNLGFPGGWVLKVGTTVTALTNDGVGNPIMTVIFINPFQNSALTCVPASGDASVNGATAQVAIRGGSSLTKTGVQFSVHNGVIGNNARINWLALGN